jgi:hypothetical protein
MRSFERLNSITCTMPRRSFERTEFLNHLDYRMWRCRNYRLTLVDLVQHHLIATANRTRGHDGCVGAEAGECPRPEHRKFDPIEFIHSRDSLATVWQASPHSAA